MSRPKFKVDFNEMPEEDLVLFSKENFRTDSLGRSLKLFNGMKVLLFEEDLDEFNQLDTLVASGMLEINIRNDWSSHVRWCCRIDEFGIQHSSESSNPYFD